MNEKKLIGYYKEFFKDSDYPSLRDSFEEKPYPMKKEIAKYLLSCTPFVATAGWATDVFTGEHIKGEELGIEDDKYFWKSELAYYVEKYNLRLPKEVEDHILRKINKK